EGLVTTLGADGVLNLAPMGPRMDPGFERFVLRPFPDSTTYQNLLLHPEGVLHVTDDVLLLARSAISRVRDAPSRPAERVRGRVLVDCCRFYEFRVRSIDDREARVWIECEVVFSGSVRDFFGFNRAKHSILELAIHATRIGIVPMEPMLAEL